MPRLLLVAAILALMLAACGSATSSPSQAAADPTPMLTLSPTPPATPIPTAAPSPARTPAATPDPTATPGLVAFTAKERYLQRGVLRDAVACQPVRTDLPKQAVAGIECASKDPAVARIGFYLFKTDAAMLAAYFARMDA